jgi:PadR family transcriptional regulator PadR
MSAENSLLLEQWEQNYKKGLLSFWMLMAIAEKPVYAYEMREKIIQISAGSIHADENSIYRALRRFTQNELVKSQLKASDKGPNRRYFQLSKKGEDLLSKFIQRNLLVFGHKKVISAMKKITTIDKDSKKEKK